ncbi:MAG TPA: VWA domain-containing protein [Planctomycetaceae bacterium]|nr:VWA domain-containing protein [Planctomycetaceae bacterium]
MSDGVIMLNSRKILFRHFVSHTNYVLCSVLILMAISNPVAAQVPLTETAVEPASLGNGPGGGDFKAGVQAPSPPVSSALRSIFSASAAPERKTMGLLQRSFVEVAQQTEDNLEIALVIDGTDSMADEIEGVKQSVDLMMEDLRRGRIGKVSVAIIVYRDSGSPSGVIEVLQDRFTDDMNSIRMSLQRLTAASGAPFFHEMPDAGVHAALEQLPWSADGRTTQWVFLFGDAPPYAENFASAEVPKASRAYATDLLIALASRKQIQIHCVLCTSSKELDPIYRQALPETRQFMNALASGTGGMMLDLSYPDIRNAITQAGRQPRFQYQQIEPITQDDLVEARAAEAAANGPPDPKTAEVRIAILPHLPIREVSFDARNPAVQVAAGLRHKLEGLPRVRVASPYDVKRQMDRLKAGGLSESILIRELAARLGVDYIVWGTLDQTGTPIVSNVFERRSGELVAKVSHAGEVTQLASVILNSPMDDKRFGSLKDSQRLVPTETITQQLQKPLAKDEATTRELLTALESLQQVIGLLVDDPQSQPLLATAQAAAEAALVSEPDNGLAYWLLANIHFNRGSRALADGNSEAAQAAMAEMKRELSRAFRFVKTIDSLSLANEIMSDHCFLVDRNLPLAIKRYEALSANPSVCPSVRRRAHWILTGIYCGDWGVEPNFVNPQAARKHAIAIMANWETSPEANLLRKWLGWDPKTNRTEHPHLPLSHSDLAKL